MAWYPLAIKKVIAPGPNDPPIIAMGAILHVDSGDNKSLFEYFSSGKSDGVESHFFVRKDGAIEQYRDTAYEADANLKANSFMRGLQRFGYVSIETQGKDAGEWNDLQLAAIKTLLKWLSETHNFPLRKCRDPQDPGVGYHTMWGAPGPWTPKAKTCPGPDRIRQFNAVLVPWFSEGHSKDAIEGMTEAEVQEILAALKTHADAETARYSDLADRLHEQDRVSLARYKEFHDTLSRIEGAVTPVDGDGAK